MMTDVPDDSQKYNKDVFDADDDFKDDADDDFKGDSDDDFKYGADDEET